MKIPSRSSPSRGSQVPARFEHPVSAARSAKLSKQRRRKALRARRVFLEELEDRRMLAVVGSFDFSDAQGLGTSEGFTTSGPSNQWHVSIGRSATSGHSPVNSFYFGSGEGASGGGTYIDNADGSLLSPVISLANTTAARLNFNQFLQVEPGDDVATVSVIHSGGKTVIATSGVELANSNSVFIPVQLNLSQFVGQSIQLEFRLTSNGAVTREGWYVDDVVVTTANTETWRSEGPFAATDGQVENTLPSDQIIGAIHTVLAHPTDANTLYIGATNGGIWKTTNATSLRPNWVPLTDHLPSLSIGAMAFDTADPTFSTIYAGTGRFSSFAQVGNDRVGLYKSTDGGQSWTILNDKLAGANISGVTAHGNNVVVSVNVADSFTFQNVGIFRSTDGGATFTQKSLGNGALTGLPGGVSYDLVVDPINPSVLYTSTVFSDFIGGINGIYKSSNFGESWTKVSSLIMDEFISSGGPGVLTTTNLELAVGRHNEVYAAVINNGDMKGLFRSNNGGGFWTRMDTPSTNENGIDVGLNPRGQKGPGPNDGATPDQFAGGQGSIHFSIVADPDDPNLVYVGGDRQPRTFGDQGTFPNSIGANDFSGRLFRGDASKPSGSQFVHLTHSNVLGAPGGGTASGSSPHADSREMTFDANGNLIEVDDGGIYRRTSPKTNTGDWFGIIGNLQTTEAHNIAYDTISNTIITGNQDTGTTYQSSAGAQTWISRSTADGGDVAVDDVSLAASNQSIRYSSFQNLGAFRKTVFDAAGNIVSETFPARNGLGAPTFVTTIAVNEIDPSRIVVQGAVETFESFDQAESFTGLGAAPNSGFPQSAIVYGGSRGGQDNPNVLWVGSGSDVFVRTGTGPLQRTASDPTPQTVRDLSIDPFDWSNAFVTTANSVFVTDDVGASWTNITGNLLSLATTFYSSVYVATGLAEAIVVGTNRGVFASLASSLGVWVRLGEELPNALVYDMDYDAKDDVLVAGTLGRGAWKLNNVASSLSVSSGITTATLDANNNLVIRDTDGNYPDKLTIQSDTTNNRFVISGIQQTIQTNIVGATGNDTHTVTIPFAAVTGNEIVFNTLGGRDELTVDYSLGTFSKPINYRSGVIANDIGNALTLVGVTLFANATYTFAGPGAGTIAVSGSSLISFTQVSPIVSELTTTDTRLNYNDDAGTLVVTGAGLGVNGLSIGSAIGEGLLISIPSRSLVIDGSGGMGVGAHLTGAIDLAGSSLEIIAEDILLERAVVATDRSGGITLVASDFVDFRFDSRLSTIDGDITVTSTATSSPGTTNRVGIDVTESTIVSVNGDISLDGIARGGNAPGVLLRQGARLQSTGVGNISIVGTASGTPQDVIVVGSGVAIDGSTGDVEIVANKLSIDDVARISGAGQLVITPRNIDTSIDVGVTALGTLQISDALIAKFADGFAEITIGDAVDGTGAVVVDTATFTDSVRIAGGNVDVQQLSSVGNTVSLVANGGIITGSVSSGNIMAASINLDGDVAPGNVTGNINLEGDVRFVDGGQLTLQIGGLVPGAGLGSYEQLNLTGGFAIGSDVQLNLVPAGGFVPSIGNVFVIVNNDGTDAINGVFRLLPQGSVIPNFLGSGLSALVEYTSGIDGNDIVLSVLPELTLSISQSQTLETNGRATITASLAAPAIRPVTIVLGFGGTATLGDDYNSTNLISIPAGAVSGTVQISTIPDVSLEFNETVEVRVASVANAISDPTRTLTLTIVDDDFLTPVISTTTINPTNLSPVPVRISFGGSVALFDISDVQATNASVSNFSALGGGVFTVDVTPANDGTFTLRVAAGAALDIRSIGTRNSNVLTLTSDRTIPVPLITGQVSPTNSLDFDFAISFGESVIGFDVSDIDVTNGSVTNLVNNGGGDFTATIRALSDGDVTTEIAQLKAMDLAGNGNGASNSLVITVDTVSPTLTVPSSIIVEADTVGGASITSSAIAAFLSGALATDAVDPNVVITHNATAVLPLGSNVITFFATDDAGNVASATATVTVADTTRPNLSVPSTIVAEGDTLGGANRVNASIAAFLGAATATDIVDSSVDIIHNAPVLFILGTTSVTFEARDDSGNSTFAEVAVRVVDTSPPQLVAPLPLTLEGNTIGGISSSHPSVVSFIAQATASDTVSSVVLLTNNAPALFSVGATPVTFTATDSSGNATSTVVVVTVTDTTAPVISVGIDVTVEADAPSGTTRANSRIQAVLLATSATDTVDSSVLLTNDAPLNFPLGETVIRFTARDDAGNQTAAQAKVTVVDSTTPTLTVPNDIVVEADSVGGALATNSSVVAFLAAATASDIVDTSVNITTNSPTLYPLGDTVVVFTATDDSGNRVTGSAKVTVVDTKPPVIIPPSSIRIEGDTIDGALRTGVAVSAFLAGATASDIADPLLSSIANNAPAVFPIGETQVTFSVTDTRGNLGTAIAIVTVVDTTPAAIVAPAGITLEADSANGASVTQNAFITFLSRANAVDLVDRAPSISTDAPSSLPLGDTLITFTATDDAGNVSTASSTVRVVDTTAPNLIVPASVSVEGSRTGGVSAADPAVSAFLSNATATDTVDPSPVVTNSAGASLPLGANLVTFTATDRAGNRITRSSTITIVDTNPPAVNVPADIRVEADTVGGARSTNPGILAFLRSASVADTVDASASIAIISPNVYVLGRNVVTFSSTDTSGNSAVATAVVDVIDSTPPSLVVPANLSVEANTSGGTAISNPAIANLLTSAIVSDIADAAPVISNDAPSLFPIGDTRVTFTARDASGNVVTATTTVSVNDSVAPTLTAPQGITLEGDVVGGTASTRSEIVALIQGASASDAIDPNPAITTDALKPFIPLGSTILTYRAVDASGNLATATTTITVVDTTAPTLNVADNITVPAVSEAGARATVPAIASFLAATTASDHVEQFPVITNDAPAVFPIGVTRVTFSASDASGNRVTKTGTVTVTPLPVFDFGDAPTAANSGFTNSYPTRLLDNGARHAVGTLTLGSLIDSEADGQPNPLASGDGSDDDGVFVLSTIVTASSATASSIQVVASQAGRIDAWVDFNRDGDWSDAGEKIFNSIALASGVNLLSFSVPAGAQSGNTFARFRLSTSGGLAPTGVAANGEVEDYQLAIVSGGANSVISVGAFGGSVVVSRDASGNIVARSGLVETFRAPAASVGRIDVQGGTANDDVTLDFESGLAIPNGGLRLNGGAGSNTLRILGGATLDLTSPRNSVTNFDTIVLPAAQSEIRSQIIVDAAAVARLVPVSRVLNVTPGPSSTVVVNDALNWRILSPVIQNGRFFSQARNILGGNETIIAQNGSGYHNFVRPGDVNNDGRVTSADALLVVFELNTPTVSDVDSGILQDPLTVSPWPGIYFDSNADNKVTAADALLVINDIFLDDLTDNFVEAEFIATDTLKRSVLPTFESAADDDIQEIIVFDSIQKITSKPVLVAGAVIANSVTIQDANTYSGPAALDALLGDHNFLDDLLDD